MCVILFIHIYISRNIYVFHVYIYTIIYTCVSTYYIHKRPMNFHSSLQMSFVLQYAPCCISMRKPDSAGCLIGWFQFHGAHDLIKTFVTVGYKTILVEFTLQLKIIIGGVTKPLKSSVNAFNVCVSGNLPRVSGHGHLIAQDATDQGRSTSDLGS